MDVNYSINEIVTSINQVAQAIQINQSHWWNTQWFSAIIGATAGFIGTSFYSALKSRNKKLFDYYQWFLEQGTFHNPQGLLGQASSTSYGKGDKPLAEKMVIEFRSHTKYWYKPFSIIRFLHWRYENSLWKIKNGKSGEVQQQKEYKEAEKRFKKIMDYIYWKTGESEWTS